MVADICTIRGRDILVYAENNEKYKFLPIIWLPGRTKITFISSGSYAFFKFRYFFW